MLNILLLLRRYFVLIVCGLIDFGRLLVVCLDAVIWLFLIVVVEMVVCCVYIEVWFAFGLFVYLLVN